MSVRRRSCLRRWLLAVFGLALAACAGPVQATRVDPKVVHGDLAQSAVTTGDPSLPTRNVLFELGLFDRAVDSMSPGHPFILGLQSIPGAQSVTVNSMVAVEGDGPVAQGDDGVVKYSAAHIEPVESELIVRSGHSVQGNPNAIEEVRRILRLHGGLR